MQAGQCYWVRFAAAELDSFEPQETFDAIIGRLILMYLPDPAATLRRLSRHLVPGGIVAFQVMAMPATRSVPEGPLYARCRRWILDAFEHGGFEVDMGPKLHATFEAAGLPAPQMMAAGGVEAGRDAFANEYIAEALRSLLPMTERAGIVSAGELGPDTLAERLRQEALANKACIMLPPLIGAWTRKGHNQQEVNTHVGIEVPR